MCKTVTIDSGQVCSCYWLRNVALVTTGICSVTPALDIQGVGILRNAIYKRAEFQPHANECPLVLRVGG
jgi:hypothetical protein